MKAEIGAGYRRIISDEVVREEDEFLCEENTDPPFEPRRWLIIGDDKLVVGTRFIEGAYAPMRRKI